MLLVKPSYQILAGSGKYKLPYNYEIDSEKLIEFAGRTCYKSEDKINEESATDFVNGIKKRKHLSVFEHSWKYRFYNPYDIPRYKFLNYLELTNGILVAGNFRAFDEWDYNHKNDNVSMFIDEVYKIIYERKAWNMLSASVKLIVDRGVTHEIVRHRSPTYSQESTRFCNYSKDKFGGHVTFIIPPWVDVEEGEYTKYLISENRLLSSGTWVFHMLECEKVYKELLNLSWSPQQARSVLPNSLKTEIVITADLQEWIHIFNLRALGTTGTSHPQMLEIMEPLYKDFQKLFPEVFV